jgi:hypothetical protein
MLAKRGHERRRHRDRPDRPPRLRFLEDAPISYVTPDPNAAAVPIDVAPSQRQELASAHPRRYRGEDGDAARAVSLREQLSNLGWSEDVELFPLHRGRFTPRAGLAVRYSDSTACPSISRSGVRAFEIVPGLKPSGSLIVSATAGPGWPRSGNEWEAER